LIEGVDPTGKTGERGNDTKPESGITPRKNKGCKREKNGDCVKKKSGSEKCTKYPGGMPNNEARTKERFKGAGEAQRPRTNKYHEFLQIPFLVKQRK